MFKILITCIFVFNLFMPFQLCWGENFDLRHTRWGMTQEEVIKSEEKMDPVEVTENMIQYKTQIMKNNVGLQYVFVEDKLIGAIYKLDDNFINSDRFRSTYNKFRTALINKYGQPSEDKTNWVTDTFKNDRKKWGLALSLGHVEYASSWRTKNTFIECSLREENYYVLCLIEYWSSEFSDLIKGNNKADRRTELKQADQVDPL